MKVIHKCPTNSIVFFAFNIVLMLIGSSYLGIGSWLVEAFDYEKERIDLINQYYTSMGILMLIIGALCVLLSFFGYLLSFWKRVSTLISYLIILCLIFLFGISIGIVGFIYANKVEYRITEDVNEKLFLSDDFQSIKLVNSLQQNFECCGYNGPHDWSAWINKISIPNSCCETLDKQTNTCPVEKSYKNGCKDRIRKSIFTDMLISGALSIGIILPIILGMVSVISLIVQSLEKLGKISYHSKA